MVVKQTKEWVEHMNVARVEDLYYSAVKVLGYQKHVRK